LDALGHHIYWLGPIIVANDYKLEELGACSHSDFEEFYRIYADSIAARERKSRSWICEIVGRSDDKILLLRRQNQVIGFSVLFLPQSENFGVLEYMAIADAYRNQGLGGELFRQAMEAARLARQGQPGPMLLEVDSDREESPDQELRRRRQQFYRRLGCAMISGLHYIMPLPGVGPPPEMDLFIYGKDRRQISKAELEKWLKIIYQGIYNCPPEDPRIGEMLAGVSDPILLT
jgi:ribosomal protein S18 acetylase RimI-like enzyme